ncbi:MAG: (d)CMP kinase [Alphaproteobacteria bacterium]|nr:(d)CMP kinase [Alphaproteobacteria bacterium]
MSILPVIAIDGPAASGKGTLARRIAATMGFAHLDTGTLYRVVGLAVLKAGRDPNNAYAATAAVKALDLSLLEDRALRSAETGVAASQVGANPAVREALLEFQRNFAAHPPGGQGAVLDGRDIGTVICPSATVKLFVTATPEIRARRRYMELFSQGSARTEAEVLADILSRDHRDMSRPVAPLAQASDAHLLDTTQLDIEAAVALALEIVRAALRT